MKPRLTYNWEFMVWSPVDPFDHRGSIVAQVMNRRIRLQHVGGHR